MAPRAVSGRHWRQSSDELMADLENQLGDSQMAYMKVRVTYSHSAFSDYFGHEILVGVSQRCTRLETTVVAALKQHNCSSAWSPRPTYSTDSLKCLLTRYWKDDVVTEWLEKIEYSRNGVVREASQHQAGLTTPTMPFRPQAPARRPTLFMDKLLQAKVENSISEPQNTTSVHDDAGMKYDAMQDKPTLNLHSTRSSSRNTSGTTCTSGSVINKKSFVAGIWRSLTPSVNLPGNGADGAANLVPPGPWNWNSWF